MKLVSFAVLSKNVLMYALIADSLVSFDILTLKGKVCAFKYTFAMVCKAFSIFYQFSVLFFLLFNEMFQTSPKTDDSK